MKFGVPWRVEGIHADARETAREAARRSGVSVGEWLNAVIIDSALEAGVRPRRGVYAEPGDSEAGGDDLSDLHGRLDALTRRLDRLARTANVPPAGYGKAPAAADLTEAVARLGRRLDRQAAEESVMARENEDEASDVSPGSMPDIAQAIAEIMARQKALDADPGALVAANIASVEAEAPVAASTGAAENPPLDFSGLEQQLRRITTQVEALQPYLDSEVAALRRELRDIANNLTEAMPRRAIEALQSEVQALAGRFDSSRNFAVDAAALTAVERGLAELREALHSLKPAESLVGIPEAVRNLAEKVDYLAATRQDPAAFQQLEESIATLRGIVAHVASNDALAQLGGEVRALAVKIDELMSSSVGNALATLEARVSQIAAAIETRVPEAGTIPAKLEAVIKELIDKIERLQLTRGDHMALGHLEDRIAQLVEKLDASGTRFTQIEAIERGLADLLVYIETHAAGGAQTAAPAAATNIDGLQRDIARTQSSLEALHGTLGHVVDRLAMIETDLRNEARARPPTPPAVLPASPLPHSPAPPLAPPVNTASRASAAAAAAAAMARANPPPPRRPIDPSLPPDHPLEPGAGVGRDRLSASLAEEIAVSQTDPGLQKPPVLPDPGGKSNFIAAARRASRTATAGPPREAQTVAEQPDAAPGTLSNKLAHRMRSLFGGAGFVLLAAGGYQLTANLADSPIPVASQPAAQTRAETESSPTTAKSHTAAVPAATPKSMPDNAAAPDITGAVQPPTPSWMPQGGLLPAPAATRLPSADKLPATIGGPALRTAAASGMAAAEYEVGVRYAEGRGVPPNPREAARWLELAANQSLAPAQFRLAALYEKGSGVQKDIAAAIRLYTAAAEKGHAKAMHNLAVLYADGGAAKPDYHAAAQWFRKAADHGLSDSQYNLAILYARGIGVEQNLTESYKWFALAAAQGDEEAAKKRDEIAARLDPASLTAARLAVQAWTAQPQPEEATRLAPPAGGWDAPAPVEAPKPKARASGPVRIGGI